MKKGFGLVGVLIVVGMIVIGGGVFAWAKLGNKTICTQDVKQCSDGSYVKRTAPFCKFQECPDINTGNRAENSNMFDPITGWKTYRNEEYGFQLTLTDNWENYKTFPNIYKRLNGKNNVFGVDFCLTTSSGYNECLFEISGISIEESEELQKDIALCKKEQENPNVIGRNCDDEIGRNDKYIFLSRIIVQDSSDKGALALKDVSEITDSFQTF